MAVNECSLAGLLWTVYNLSSALYFGSDAVVEDRKVQGKVVQRDWSSHHLGVSKTG